MSTLQKSQPRLFFSGPLFCRAEREYNERLCHQLESMGFSVFLPQRDGVESSKPPYNKMSLEERNRAIFAVDRDELLAADIYLFVLDGRIPDEGACVELGIAYGQRYFTDSKKILVGLHTDRRIAFPSTPLNQMIGEALDRVFTNEEELFAYLLQTVRDLGIVKSRLIANLQQA